MGRSAHRKQLAGLLRSKVSRFPHSESDRIAIPLRSATEGYFQLLHFPYRGPGYSLQR